MTKITVKESTPSAQLIAKAMQEVTVTDSTGRAIKLRKPGVLAQYRLVEVLGDSARNEVYMGMTMPLIYVSEIDGIAVSQPGTKLQVEALIQRLDEHGIGAVMDGVQEHFGKQNPEADKAAIKN